MSFLYTENNEVSLWYTAEHRQPWLISLEGLYRGAVSDCSCLGEKTMVDIFCMHCQHSHSFLLFSPEHKPKRPYQLLWFRDIGDLTWLCTQHHHTVPQDIIHFLHIHSSFLHFAHVFLSKTAKHRGFLFSYHS